MNMPEPGSAAPRAAIVVTDQDYYRISSDPRRAHLLDAPDSLVIPYSARPTAQIERVLRVRQHLIVGDQLSPGQLLLRDPYSATKYAYADEAIETFVKEKYYNLAAIAAHLGASSIAFVKVEVEHDKSTAEGGFAAKIKGLTPEVKAARHLENRLEGRFEASTQLDGKAINVDAARTFMRERRMARDPDVVGLIDLYATGSRLRKHRVKVNGLRESTRSFQAGLDLTAGLGLALGGGTFVQAAESIKSVEVTTEIDWPSG